MHIINTPLARQNVLLLLSSCIPYSITYDDLVFILHGVTKANVRLTVQSDEHPTYTEYFILGINYPISIFVPNSKIPLLFRKKSQKNKYPKKAKITP